MLAPSPSGADCSCTLPPRSQIDVEISSNQIVGVRPLKFAGTQLQARMPSVLQDASIFGPAPQQGPKCPGAGC